MTDADPTAGVVAIGVGRSFGNVHAVRDATFQALPGQVTGLIGPNGSGKTTLLLMLGTLLVPDRGTITIGGFDPVHESKSVRSVMGWMPDTLGSWPTLTVRETLILTARLYGFDRDRATSRADELIHLVDLVPLALHATRVLSRGQKQRLSLARSLVHDPKVLLLDEPASGLDPGARVSLRKLVRRLAEEGRTIVVSSHVLAELDEMADTAVYLDGGVTASESRIAAAKASMRAWRISSLAPGELRAALVKAGVADDSITVAPTGLDVPLAGEAAAAELLAALVKAKVPVTSFAPAVGELEHTFLDLSGESAS
jgi:ABC-type multidrug transport system ATPase subunit